GRGQVPEIPDLVVRFGLPGVSRRVRWINVQRLGEEAQRGLQILRPSLVPIVPAFHVEPVGRRIDSPTRSAETGTLLRRELDLDPCRHRPGDLALQSQDIRHYAIIALGPQRL